MSRRRIVKLSVGKVGKVGAPAQAVGVNVTVASDFVGRLVGLLAHRSLSHEAGMLLTPCASIHTLGMRFAIDVLFLDKNGRVLGFADAVVPNRFRFAPKNTAQVLEMAEGNRIRTGINLDDQLNFG